MDENCQHCRRRVTDREAYEQAADRFATISDEYAAKRQQIIDALTALDADYDEARDHLRQHESKPGIGAYVNAWYCGLCGRTHALGFVHNPPASCGHPRNDDGECDCSSWPERAPVYPGTDTLDTPALLEGTGPAGGRVMVGTADAILRRLGLDMDVAGGSYSRSDVSS